MYSSMTFSGLRSSKALGEEFRQHDGVVTILMNYRRRALPKHRDNMTEVEYGGGGHPAEERSRRSTCVSMGCPLPPYIKEWRRGGPALSMVRPRGVLLPPGVGFPLS